jgi:hypothetical protein
VRADPRENRFERGFGHTRQDGSFGEMSSRANHATARREVGKGKAASRRGRADEDSALTDAEWTPALRHPLAQTLGPLAHTAKAAQALKRVVVGSGFMGSALVA